MLSLAEFDCNSILPGPILVTLNDVEQAVYNSILMQINEVILWDVPSPRGAGKQERIKI